MQIFKFKGKADFNDLKIIFDPLGSAYLGVTSPAIKKYYKNYFSLHDSNNQIELKNKYTYLLSISMRKCIRGEIYIGKLNM